MSSYGPQKERNCLEKWSFVSKHQLGGFGEALKLTGPPAAIPDGHVRVLRRTCHPHGQDPPALPVAPRNAVGLCVMRGGHSLRDTQASPPYMPWWGKVLP